MLLSEEQHNYLVKNVKGLGNDEITKMLNDRFGTSFSVKQIKAYKKNHKISSGLTGRFQPGCLSHNKGKRPSQEVLEKCSKGWFKKGNVPHNYLPVGAEITNTDGYIKVKIADPNKWEFKHILIWKQAYGTIPDGCNITFRNHDKSDVRLDNLVAVSKKVHSTLNRMGIEERTDELVKVVGDICTIRDAIRKFEGRCNIGK